METTSTIRRRDSMSIFDEVNHVNPIPVVIILSSIFFPEIKLIESRIFHFKTEHKSGAVIKTLSLVLQAIICDLKPSSPFNEHFKNVLENDEL